MMWKRLLAYSALLLLLSYPIFSEENPESMTEAEILSEISMLSGLQLKDWESLETGLEKQQTRIESLEIQLRAEESELNGSILSLESSIDGMEKELGKAKGWNIALIVLTGIATGLAIYAMAR